jgi:hypothetical protein
LSQPDNKRPAVLKTLRAFFVANWMSARGDSLQGRPSGKCSHVRRDAPKAEFNSERRIDPNLALP